MKRSICLFLLTLLLICFTSCVPTVQGQDEVEYDYSGYKSIECAGASEWEIINIGASTDADCFEIAIPKGWFVIKNGNSLDVYKGKAVIGNIIMGAPDNDELSRSDIGETRKNGKLTCTSSILSVPRAEDAPECDYFRQFTYTYKEGAKTKRLCMTLNYESLDSKAAEACIDKAALGPQYGDIHLGRFKLSGSETKQIMVFGNSFIGTSRINSFLQTMFAGENYNVTALAQGYASVSGGNWDSYISSIEAGMYDIIFMCGFYSAQDAPALAPYVEACRASGTKLVVFPAHNETAYQAAVNTYPDVELLDWKDEINTLMQRYEIDQWDFCIDDAHKHSTPLAGYVGAHMIYRSVTGEYPPEHLSYNDITSTALEGHLKAYMTDGAARRLDKKIWFLNPK